jgi:outer membrane protein TolC
VVALAAFAIFSTNGNALAQPVSLEQALQRAIEQSEAVGIARAAASRSLGEQMGARSQFMPQIVASLGYTKTLESQYESFASSSGNNEPDVGPPPPPRPCGQYLRDPGAGVDARLTGVETATICSLRNSQFSGLGDLPFGQENQWNIGLQLTQPVFTGGRLSASYEIARGGGRVADIELASQVAQLTLAVTEAYYDAVLADRLANIADSNLAQTELALQLTEVAREAGAKSEFEALRARVTRDNQRPVVIMRKSERDLAYLRLKQLIGIQFDDQLQLSTVLQEENLQVGALPASADTSAMSRAAVRQAAELIAANENMVRIQRAERMPAVNVTSQYGRVAYPSSIFPGGGDFLDNLTVGIGLQLPVFTGGRIRGAEVVARANVDEARLKMAQAGEVAALDARTTVASLREAEESWRASLGTVEQAQRAYEIAEVRFREGLSTQLELTESRVLLQTAQANRAVAARNLQVVRVRLSVLRDLPLAPNGSQQRLATGIGSGGQQ